MGGLNHRLSFATGQIARFWPLLLWLFCKNGATTASNRNGATETGSCGSSLPGAAAVGRA